MENMDIANDGVWLLIAGWDYEGSELLGAYGSEDLANKAKEKRSKADGLRYDYYKVEHHYVICS